MFNCPDHEGEELDYSGEWYFEPEDAICEFYTCPYWGNMYVKLNNDKIFGPVKIGFHGTVKEFYDEKRKEWTDLWDSARGQWAEGLLEVMMKNDGEANA